MGKKIKLDWINWVLIWAELEAWHKREARKNKCSKCEAFGDEPTWGEQKSKLEELVEKELKKT